MRARVILLVIASAIIGYVLVGGYRPGTVPDNPSIIAPTSTVGCTGSISFRIEDDGTVTTWCPK